MNYQTFAKKVQQLSHHYHVTQSDHGQYTYVLDHNEPIVIIQESQAYEFNVLDTTRGHHFDHHSFSHRLYMLCAEYAMTQPENRQTQSRYQIIVATNDLKQSVLLNHGKDGLELIVQNAAEVGRTTTYFTVTEISRLATDNRFNINWHAAIQKVSD